MRIVRRVAFSVVALLALLGATELAARVSGRAPTIVPSPFPFQNVGSVVPQRIPGGIRWPYGWRRVSVSPARGTRVLLFGESAAAGDAYTPWVSMGGVMERALQAASPDTPVEVLNLATPGAGSRQIVEVVRAAVAAERPDAIVLYVGNNELHELRGLKTVMPGYDARAELLRRRLWRSHAYRLLTAWLVPPPERFVVDARRWPALGSLTTRADADDRALAMLFYEENLREMLRAAAGVPVVLATVAVNGTGLDPMARPEERVPYEAARAAERAGRTDEARALYRRSLSLASRPTRALPETYAIVPRVAADTGARACDVAGVLGAAGLLGGSLFDDACHPSVAGHARIGAVLAGCVGEALGTTTPEAPARPMDDRRLDAWTHRRGTRVEEDGTPDVALRAGNAAFTDNDFVNADAWYRAAEERGADAGLVALNRGLAALYREDLSTARSELARAHAAFPDDADVTRAWRTIAP